MRLLRPAALLFLLAAGALWFAALGVPERASAHAVLERSTPAQDQRLSAAPPLVETWYSEPLERALTSLQVPDTQGNPVHTGETQFSDDPLYASIALPPDLAPGVYTVAYQNVSTVDGHGWSGALAFIVLNADGTDPGGTAFAPEGFEGGGQGFLPEVGDSVLRWMALLAAVGLGGAAAFYLVVAQPAAGFLDDAARRRVQEALMDTTAVLALAAMPVLILAGAGQLGLLVDRLGGSDALDDVLFNTRTGALLLARHGLALIIVLLFLPALLSERWRSGARAAWLCALAMLSSLGLLITYSLGSHAGVGGGQFWSVGSDFVHLAATAAWLGTLLQLPLVFWWSRDRLHGSDRLLYLANVFDRFSWLAVVSVTLIIATGVFNGFVQLPTLESLWDTTYGRVLIVKLGLILPLLGVAGVNAVLLKPALVDAIDALRGLEPEERPRSTEQALADARLGRLQRALPRTAAIEFLLGAAVIASVSILAQSTTAEGELRQQAAVAPGEFRVSDQAGDLEVELLIEPYTVGVNTFTTTLQPLGSAQLGEVLDVELRAVFDDPSAPASAGVGAARQALAATDDPAVFRAEATLLTQPGDWRLEARIRRREAEDVSARFVASQLGGALATAAEPEGLFDLPFTSFNWNDVAGGALVALGLAGALLWLYRPPSWQRSTGTAVGLGGAFIAAAGVALFVIVPDEPPAIPFDSPVPATEVSLARGRASFENNCRMCHGPQGEGDGPLAAGLRIPPPPYRDHVPVHSDRVLFNWISEGIPIDSEDKNMPSFKDDLSTEERWNLVNFLRDTWGEGAPVAEPDASPTPGAPQQTAR